MSQFIKEFGIIDEKIEEELFAEIYKNPLPFATSQLYSPDQEKKFIDLDIRSSRYREIKSCHIFDIADKLIDKINQLDKINNYSIFRNNITHIVYNQGDFFHAHEDYLSVISNVIQEYTMIICMDANCEGGDTLFYINDWFKYACKSSTTKGHCMLFRKDLKHEGLKLLSGTKHILTLNIWVTPKSEKKLVVINCSDSPSNVVFSSDLKSNSNSSVTINYPSLEEDVDAEKINSMPHPPPQPYLIPTIPKYCISIDKILGTNTLLDAFLKFSKGKPNQAILTYNENVSEEDFTVIYKLYNKMYITIDEFKKYRSLIDYYQFKIQDILIDMMDMKTKKIQDVPKSLTFKEDVIFSPTPEHFNYVKTVVIQDKMPYIPFKMIVGEGSIFYGGGMTGTDPTHLEMQPMWVSFSDHHNLLFKHRFFSADTPKNTLKSVQDQFPHVGQLIRQKLSGDFHGLVRFAQEEDEESKEVKNEKNKEKCEMIFDKDITFSSGMYAGLEICELASESDILEEITDEDRRWGSLLFFMPKDINYPDVKQSQYYDIDKDGLISITPKHYKKIIRRVKETRLLESIKNNIPTIDFLIPQSKVSGEMSFCNENIYLSCNILILYGFLRLK